MTTVTLSVREEKDYTPPKAPTFPSQIASSWSGSLKALQFTGQRLLLALVTFAPWGIAMSVVILPLVVALKRRHRKSASV